MCFRHQKVMLKRFPKDVSIITELKLIGWQLWSLRYPFFKHDGVGQFVYNCQCLKIHIGFINMISSLSLSFSLFLYYFSFFLAFFFHSFAVGEMWFPLVNLLIIWAPDTLLFLLLFLYTIICCFLFCGITKTITYQEG